MPKSYHSENAVVRLTSQLLESRGAGMVKFIWDSLELGEPLYHQSARTCYWNALYGLTTVTMH
jgi:hypothetical protein